MKTHPQSAAISRQIDFALTKMDSLSILPGVLTKILPLLKSPAISSDDFATTILPSPAITAKILKLAGNVTSIPAAIEKLSLAQLRESLMTVDIQTDSDEAILSDGKQYIRFAIAVGSCSELIAKQIPKLNPDTAFTAGLLHNIGKLALDQILPKGLEKISEETKMLAESDITIQRKYFGTDYTIVGKRLAQKWSFPQELTNAIWLHRADTQVISQLTTDSLLVHVVHLAYELAKSAIGFNSAGSFEPILDIQSSLEVLSIDQPQADAIKKLLVPMVQQRASLIGLEQPRDNNHCYKSIWDLTQQLAKDNAELSIRNKQLSVQSSYLDFMKDFLSTTVATANPCDVAANFARKWKEFYNTGSICICLADSSEDNFADAVVIESSNKPQQILLEQNPLLNSFKDIPASCSLIDIDDKFDWIFNQLSIEFDKNKTKALVLATDDKLIAILLWQYNYLPTDGRVIEQLTSIASLVAPVIGLAITSKKQQQLAEDFAALLNKLGNITETLASNDNIDSLAELAAGAAHELNNPIAVVSGRAQMLISQETDSDKKQALEQVMTRTQDISEIVSQLMLFAKPESPKARLISPAVLIETAVDYAKSNYDMADVDIRIDNIDNLRDVFGDSQQLRDAIAELIKNAYQSYYDAGNVVTITGTEQSHTHIRLQVIDKGCGMDDNTLHKATQPFFSAKPAGRQRGMGLAQAKRLLQINNSSLHLSSKVGQGTTATILLPCDQED